MMSISLDYLTNLQRAQIYTFYPRLRPSKCQRCGGNVIENHGQPLCLQCGAEHDQDGELVPTYDGAKPVRGSRQ